MIAASTLGDTCGCGAPQLYLLGFTAPAFRAVEDRRSRVILPACGECYAAVFGLSDLEALRRLGERCEDEQTRAEYIEQYENLCTRCGSALVEVVMNWTLIARIRVRAAGLNNDEMWHEIEAGEEYPHPAQRAIRCSCGEMVGDMPWTADSYDGIACSHISALYTGNVVEKDNETLLITTAPQPWLVQLTELGTQMFYWRWAQRMLERSS